MAIKQRRYPGTVTKCAVNQSRVLLSAFPFLRGGRRPPRAGDDFGESDFGLVSYLKKGVNNVVGWGFIYRLSVREKEEGFR